MAIAGPLVHSSTVNVTPSIAAVAPAIVVSDGEAEIAAELPSHESVLNVLVPLVTPLSPFLHQDAITGLAKETGVATNPMSPLVPLNTLEVEMEFTDDFLLLNAIPCWSQAEIMMHWDLEWERHQGDPDWERRAEFGELPEELVYRPASNFHTLTVTMPVLNAPPTNDAPATLQEVAADPRVVETFTELSPAERDHLEMMDAFRHLKLLSANYQLANLASAELEAA